MSLPRPLAWRWVLLAMLVAGWPRAAEQVEPEEEGAPVWLVSNGFHTSLGLRREDVPFAEALGLGYEVETVLIGWGALEFYQGRTNAWTTLRAVVPGPSALHVVPVLGTVARQFPHSDVVRLRLSPANLRRLLAELEAAFARGPEGARVDLGAGYSGGSRFYAGRERFYFPRMCNVWAAGKLRRCGVRVWVPGAVTASELIRQGAQVGRREGWLSTPSDVF